MKRSILSVLIGVAIVILWSQLLPGQEQYKRPQQQIADSCVRIEVQDGNALSIGSGVCVSPDGWILTAGHVVGSPGSPATVAFPSGLKLSGKVVQNRYREGVDLATVKVNPKTELPFSFIAWESPSTGEVMTSHGYPDGQPYSGRMKVIRTVQSSRAGLLQAGSAEMVEVDQPFIEGNSGGFISNDMREVCGIVVGRITVSQSGTAICPRECSEILVRSRVRFRFRRPRGFLLFGFRPQLWVVMGGPCQGCEAFKREFGSNSKFREFLTSRWRIHFIDGRRAVRWRQRMAIESIPAFVFSNSDKIIFGFQDVPSFMEELTGNLNQTPPERQKQTKMTVPIQIEEEDCEMPDSPGLHIKADPNDLTQELKVAQVDGVPYGYPQPPQPALPKVVPAPLFGAPPLNAAPAPAAENQTLPPSAPPPVDPNADLALCQAIVCVPQIGFIPPILGGVIGGIEKGAVLAKLTGAIGKATSGKVSTQVVFRRSEEQRFLDLCKATGLDPVKGGVVLLVPASVKGLAGAVAKQVEGIIEGLSDSLLSALPVREVFERSSSEKFTAVKGICDRDYGETGEDSPVGPSGYAGGLLSLLFYHVHKYLKGDKSQQVPA